jgi:hypothetical protein
MLSFCARPWLAIAGLLALSMAAPCQQSSHAAPPAEQNASPLPQFDVAAIRPDHWRPDDAMHADSSGPSLFTALKQQIGLKLEMQKRPVDVVIIDHIERPSQN